MGGRVGGGGQEEDLWHEVKPASGQAAHFNEVGPFT